MHEISRGAKNPKKVTADVSMHEISRGAKNPHEAPKLTELRDKLIQATTGDIAGVISHLHG